MFWESFASAVLGLAVAYAAVRRYPNHFRQRRLALATGPGAAFFGGLLTYAVVGAGNSLIVLAMGVLVSLALLSLLIHPGPAARPHRTARLTG